MFLSLYEPKSSSLCLIRKLDWIFHSLRELLVWNFIYGYFMGTLQQICFYTFIGFYCHPTSIPNGIVNFLFTLLTLAMILAGLFLIFLKITMIRKIKLKIPIKKEEKTEPDNYSSNLKNLKLRRVSLNKDKLQSTSHKSVFNTPKKKKMSIRPSILEESSPISNRSRNPGKKRDLEDDLFVIVEEDGKNIEAIYDEMVKIFFINIKKRKKTYNPKKDFL
jgi:hypothetical protein